MYTRKRRGSYQTRMPPLKRQRTAPRYRGLVPTYRGFTPRAFSRGEWKYLDTAIALNMNTTAAQLLVNGLAPGSGASERIGQKVMVRSIQLRLVQYVTAGTGADQFHRVLLFVDRQANGAAPTLGSQLSANSVLGMRSLVNRKRFKILWDKSCHMNATAEPGSMLFRKAYIKFRRPLVVEFNAGVAGTIADIVSNSLYFYVVGSLAAGPTAGGIEGVARIRYTDQ